MSIKLVACTSEKCTNYVMV